MKRLPEYSVAWGLRIAWRLATCPTSRWPSSVNATTDGVVRLPSVFGITSAWPPSMTDATTEFVVPRSMPTAFAIARSSQVRLHAALGRGARLLGPATIGGRAAASDVKRRARSRLTGLDGAPGGPTARPAN